MVSEPYTVPHPAALEPGRRWFVTGLCYAYAGFPESLIQLMRPSKGPVKVTTYLLPRPVYVPGNFQMPLDNWQRTVQGLLIGSTMDWLSKLEAAEIRTPAGVWRVRVRDVWMIDPFSPLNPVQLLYLLPRTRQKKLEIVNAINNAVILKEQHNG